MKHAVQRFKDWLHKEPANTKQYFSLIWSIVVFNLITSILVVIVADIFGVDSPRNGTGNLAIFTLSFPFILLGAMFTEELLFRALPVAITSQLNWILQVLTGIISSIIFGYKHGGIFHIFVQGISGFSMYLLFMKTSNMGKKIIKGFGATFLEHIIFNGLLIDNS